MDNLFLTATRKKYRFESSRGELTVEQLWDMPLASRNGFDLDTVAKAVNRELKGMEEDSFVERRSNPRRNDLENMLELIKTVIAVKQDDNKKKTEAQARETLKIKLREKIEAKKDQQLGDMSIEELEAQLAAIGD